MLLTIGDHYFDQYQQQEQSVGVEGEFQWFRLINISQSLLPAPNPQS